MRTIIILFALSFSAPSFASTASANQGHHGGGNSGALGAAAGAFGGSSSASAGQSGQGGSYWAPNPHASLVDEYQAWPQSEMQAFQKP